MDIRVEDSSLLLKLKSARTFIALQQLGLCAPISQSLYLLKEFQTKYLYWEKNSHYFNTDDVNIAIE